MHSLMPISTARSSVNDQSKCFSQINRGSKQEEHINLQKLRIGVKTSYIQKREKILVEQAKLYK